MQARPLASLHSVLCPDLRGHGLTEISRAPATIDPLAGDVAAVRVPMAVAGSELRMIQGATQV